jgi:hypothetical protein
VREKEREKEREREREREEVSDLLPLTRSHLLIARSDINSSMY